MLSRERRRILWLALLAVLTTGCAAAPARKQAVRVETFPPGAELRVDGRILGRSPAVLDLERDRDHRVRAVMDGFRPAEALIRSRAQRDIRATDLLLLGIPLLVDRDRPPRYELVPERLELMLEPAGWSPR